MPEYKAPSVYVEEVSLRAKSIEGASTTTTAFVGPTALGPLTVAGEAPPSLLTGFREFEGLYGGLQDLSPGTPNYLAHAVRVYFDNGGSRIYVARVAQAAGEADYVAALDRLLELKDVSIVAAPGASTLPSPLAAQVNAALIRHAETAGAYRFAVLDPPPSLDIAGVRDLRSAYDSAAAALYYPWVLITDPRPVRPPAQPARLALPPSGFVCGVYARGDVQRGVWKAPANETVTDAVGLQREVTSGEQEVLNPLGVNCIRTFEGRGVRIWGARTVSSDPERKYVNVSRYLSYLSASVDRGLDWAAFEPNGDALWANVRQVASDFLYNEWRQGALQGTRPEDAFFVRCDQTTMTQNDLENGRLIGLVGVALIKPAEFVILRFMQRTAADA